MEFTRATGELSAFLWIFPGAFVVIAFLIRFVFYFIISFFVICRKGKIYELYFLQ